MKRVIPFLIVLSIISGAMTACTSQTEKASTMGKDTASSSMSSIEPVQDSGAVSSSSEAEVPAEAMTPIPSIKETEQVNADGSVTLLGDQYTRYVDWEVDDFTFSIPIIRGETVAQSKESITLTNSGVAMRVVVHPKEEDEKLANFLANTNISYEIDNDDIFANIELDNGYTASYLIQTGPNYDPEVLNRVIALFGIPSEELK